MFMAVINKEREYSDNLYYCIELKMERTEYLFITTTHVLCSLHKHPEYSNH